MVNVCVCTGLLQGIAVLHTILRSGLVRCSASPWYHALQ